MYQVGPEDRGEDGVLTLLAAAEGALLSAGKEPLRGMVSDLLTPPDDKVSGGQSVYGREASPAAPGNRMMTTTRELNPADFGLPSDWSVVEKDPKAGGNHKYIYTVKGNVFYSLTKATEYQSLREKEKAAVGSPALA